MKPTRSPRSLAVTVLLGLAAGTSLGACAPIIVGAGAAYIVQQEYLNDGFQETRLELDVESVWAAALDGMSILSTAGAPTITESPRIIVGEYRQRTVTVEVQAIDLGLSLLRVRAKKLVGYDEDIARDVTGYIIGRVEPAEHADG